MTRLDPVVAPALVATHWSATPEGVLRHLEMEADLHGLEMVTAAIEIMESDTLCCAWCLAKLEPTEGVERYGDVVCNACSADAVPEASHG